MWMHTHRAQDDSGRNVSNSIPGSGTRSFRPKRRFTGQAPFKRGWTYRPSPSNLFAPAPSFFAIFRCFLREHERRASRLSLRSDLLQILPFRTPNLTTKTLGPASRTTDHWSEMGLDPRGSRSSTFTHRVDSAQGISRTCCCC